MLGLRGRVLGVDPIGVVGDVLVGVLDLDPVTVERAASSSSPCTTTGWHSSKIPPGWPWYSTGIVAPSNEIVNVVIPFAVDDRALVDGALHAEPATGLAADA